MILWTLILGLIVGAVASYIMKSPHGILMDIVLGVVGAFVGDLIMNALGYGGVSGFNLYSFLVALLGSIVVIGLGRMLLRGTNRTTF